MQLSVKPKADLSHNPFDTASRDVFSLKTGMITPCLIRHTIPDSMYDCKVMGLTRTIPVQSAPFTRMSQNFEYYFVPYSQIFHDFERIYYERGDEQRNITGLGNMNPQHATQLPCFSLKLVVSALYYTYVVSRLKLELKNSPADQFTRVAQNYTFVGEYKDIHGRSCAEDMLRIFDMLGYGNYLPVFKALYSTTRAVLYDLFLSAAPSLPAEVSAFFTAVDTGDTNAWDDPTLGNEGSLKGTAEEFVGTSFVSYFSDFINNMSDEKPNVFAIAAYVKVWSDFYRNSQYDINFNYAKLFNFDFVTDDSLITISDDIICQMLIPRYRQYKKDMFTGGYPSAQFGSVAVANLENPTTIFGGSTSSTLQLLKAGTSAPPTGVQANQVYAGSSSTSYASDFIINSSVSALSVRQSLAMQRYKERILRAGNRQRSLQSAVFGDKSRYVEDLYVDFLGSEQSVLDFNAVAATASNDRSELGELGSNGVCNSNGQVFKYHSHDFGIIIGVTYILPESEYEAYMIDYFNTTSESFDFYKPDFMNLGLQEVFNFHFNNMPSFGGRNTDVFDPQVLNYLARFWPYKVAVDKVHGEFYSAMPGTFNYTDSYTDYTVPAFDSVSVGAFAEMVTPRKSNSLRNLVLPSLYVNPTDVDRIFYQISDTTQSSDQFKCVVYHDFKSVLPMSVVGLPSL